uniref:Uncharacterized protein n=1 Tax=Nelumbo nucifera TaxID=4432 RepID=A0A822Z1Q1_NELNU|nr:TPA_asm: hypothetical protein HUJ06_008050 [Nelumbo nucifera]
MLSTSVRMLVEVLKMPANSIGKLHSVGRWPRPWSKTCLHCLSYKLRPSLAHQKMSRHAYWIASSVSFLVPSYRTEVLSDKIKG